MFVDFWSFFKLIFPFMVLMIFINIQKKYSESTLKQQFKG